MSDAVRLAWPLPPTREQLTRELDGVAASGARRVEVDLDADAPASLRHLLHRRGFRLEGVAREAIVRDGVPTDVLRYARLASDPASGRELFTAVMNSVTPRKRLIAHGLLTDAAGRVLLCETSFKPDFELPGGIVEPGESPALGLVREMAEEMGADLPAGRPLVVEWLPPYLGWEDALELIFDVGVAEPDVTAALRPDGVEIVALHWLTPDAAAARMTPIAGRHLLAALAARASGETVYLEAGHRIG